MLIEIHMIQNHSPSNLNRDDLGAPKTCLFGGVPRARISSQCIKRGIRNPGNPDDVHNRQPGSFAVAMEGHIGLLTKFLPWLVEEELKKLNVDQNEIQGIGIRLQNIAKSEERVSSSKAKKRPDPRRQTPQLIRIHPALADKLAQRLVGLRNSDPDSYRYFLNPAVSFKQLVEAVLEDSQFNENQRKSILDKAWLILNCRMKELEAGTYAPDLESAKTIVTGLESLSDDKFNNILRKTSDAEKKQLKDDEPKPPKGYKDAEKRLWADLDHNCADIALFGRMTTSEFFEDVEAAMQVAHAISTHAVVNDVDYFTAVDDLGKTGSGAGHVDEAMFNSACFYKYFCLDWDQLVHNLGPEPEKPKDKKDDSPEMLKWKESHQKWGSEVKPQAEQLAACTLGHFIRAAALTTPSGKQNSFASHCEPCGVLVEIKETKIPTSYANAFADPVERIGKPEDDAPDERSIEGRSVACLADHVQAITRAYGIGSTRLWYSPKLWKFPLQYWKRSADGKKLNAEPVTAQRFEVLGGENGEPGGLVEALVKAIGFDWSQIKDVGKASVKES